ncbi:MAG TPA: ion transporter [Lachnospiraceae bacterium]|nr:ion transporter [Lachnospiraceae bacterium]
MHKFKRRIFDMIQIGNKQDMPSLICDIVIIVSILLNLFSILFMTFESSKPYTEILDLIEFITILIFIVEYVLRVWTAEFLYPTLRPGKARNKFVLSAFGLIDLFTFLPYFLPVIFPAGAVAFRMLRVVRILRLFKINGKYDNFSVIFNVLNEKKNQIFSSVLMIFIIMIASSMFMYNLEHEAQPEQFSNAFSGIWWSMSTLLTIGYGDIYPITPAGKIMAIFISFLGVGMVAIPTGIISAGFVEQYAKINTMVKVWEQKELKFFTSHIPSKHIWIGKHTGDLVFPPQQSLLMVMRGNSVILPNEDIIINPKDILLFGTRNDEEEREIRLRELKIKEENKWRGKKICDLDIYKQEIILMLIRKNKVMLPNPETTINLDDTLIIYSRFH